MYIKNIVSFLNWNLMEIVEIVENSIWALNLFNNHSY